MVITDAAIGLNVQQARYDKRLCQEELTQRVGLDRTALSRIEGGARRLTVPELVELAAALNVDVSKLLRPRPTTPERKVSKRVLFRASAISPEDQPLLAWLTDLADELVRIAPRPERPSLGRSALALSPREAGELAARPTSSGGKDSG
jgi:transcriptional regulator with XRE-family HTH domain